MKTANSIEIEQCIGSVNYPANKQAILKHAKDKSASKEVMNALNGIPDREYTNSSDVSSEIEMSTDDSE